MTVDNNGLKDRKKIILDAVVNNYIETAEPISSKMIFDKCSLDLSSATIRNELNELEQEGYLTHIHTSSGRVPTDKGYRLFVDSLMNLDVFPMAHQEIFEEKISSIGSNINAVLSQITEILSHTIDYTTIVVTPDIYNNVLKVIHLILVDIGKILVVLLNSVGVDQEFTINISERVSQDDLNRISRLLTEKLKGRSVTDIDEDLFVHLVEELPEFRILLRDLLKEVHKMSRLMNKEKNLLIKGTANMLKLPEFQNIEMTRKILEALEENKTLCNVLSIALSEKKTRVLIGKEHNVEPLNECSIVMAPIEVQEDTVGVIGVLGPKRMAYPMIVPMVQNLVGMIKNFVTKIKDKQEV